MAKLGISDGSGHRIEEGAPIPAHLEAIFVGGTALGGARTKASVRDADGVLWLTKFASNRDTFDIPGMEYASLKLATEAGLNVPPIMTTMLGNRRIMLIRRFDRYWSEAGVLPAQQINLLDEGAGAGRCEHRLGFVSGLTMLACDEAESPTKSYGELADAIRRFCHPSVIRADNEELFNPRVHTRHPPKS